MLVSYNWLKDYLNLVIDPKDLAEKITRTGIEIADVNHPMEGLKKIVVGHILSIENHPDSDHLKVAQVDVGEEETIQIVCGAPNVAADQYVIVALHGSRIAGNEKIKRSKMRGVVSNGMICALQEIGFDESVVPKQYANGIYVFEHIVEPGTPVFNELGMDDYIFDFDITPNRADTLSMEGAAHEVGAIIDQLPKFADFTPKAELPDWTNDFKISVDEELVPKYLMRKVHGVKIAPSPMWLQIRLWNAGVRPINNVVDITNYVMLETGQPLHAFDANVIKTNEILVRQAVVGEKMQLLNETMIDLDPKDLVITDGKTPVALAGVMGGLDSEVTDATEDVLIESAVFDGTSIRKTAQRHNMRSEASNRFEKGLNWDNTQKAADMAAELLEKYAKGQTYEGTCVGNNQDKPKLVIKITTTKINKVLGTELTTAAIEKIFAQLGFVTETTGEEIAVTVPNRRFDIFIDADLIEEVARIYGYDNLPSTLPVGQQTLGGYSSRQDKINHYKKLIEHLGLFETINYSLTSKEKAKMFTTNKNDLIDVSWPMNSERTSMRQSLLSGIMDTVAYNVARNQKELRLYEQGRVFDTFNGEFDEYEHLAAVYAGTDDPTNWQHLDAKTDFYYAKGQVEAFFDQIGITDKISYQPIQVSGMHPTRTAGIYLESQLIGLVGQVNPMMTKKMKSLEVYGFEINLEPILDLEIPTTNAKPAPKFPSIKRDLSLLVNKKVTNNQLVAVIEENGGKYLQNVTVFDVYQGEKIAPNKKSVAYQLTFVNEEETLTDEVITNSVEKITNALAEKLEVVVR